MEIRNIVKRYRKGNEVFTALDDVNIDLEEGEFTAITGPSGSGKSTLLYIAGGLRHPDSGEVIYKGKNIYDQTRTKADLYRKKHVGFVFQQFHLIPFLTVKDNILMGCINDSAYAQVDNYLAKCSLTEVKNKYPSELSVGEKQRTAFIRAIISGPAILLADEPTGNLDPSNGTALMLLIDEYHKKGGTVLLVSHDPDAARYANKKFFLEKGRIALS